MDPPGALPPRKSGEEAKAAAARKLAAGAAPTAEELLDRIVPPQLFSDGANKQWVQRISSTPATRIDVAALAEALDQRLQQRQARETGICPVREELYAQAFDEVIRQTTLGCVERGRLLLRVRDEVRMTTAAYQALYESSVAFGMRKALMAEQRKSELRARAKLLAAEVRDLERQGEQAQARMAELEAGEKERFGAEEERHQGEVAKLKGVNEELKETLEGLLAVKR
jgi:dynein light intermediate chain